MEEEKIDQSAVAQTVSEGIKYEFIDDFLVKPKDPILVQKEFDIPVPNGNVTNDDGIETQDYDEVTKEVKEVESDFREGIVLKVPYKYQQWMDDEKIKATNIKVGDTVVFRNSARRYFDLFKDSVLIRVYDIIAIKND